MNLARPIAMLLVVRELLDRKPAAVAAKARVGAPDVPGCEVEPVPPMAELVVVDLPSLALLLPSGAATTNCGRLFQPPSSELA